ncbi:MAG: phosphatidylglycerophosphatase A [Burkholderiales bacterium]|nr:phosphatidylglycerophosphatase A [Burkholderiales bacterium]
MFSVDYRIFKNPYVFIACGFGLGAIRPAPGTWGTLLAFPIHYGLALVLSTQQFIGVWVVIFLMGIKLCELAGKSLGQSDHSAVVIDEIVAFGLILAIIPSGLYWHALAFIVFRLFDIFKPLGIDYLDKNLKGGFGVMLDDIAAGVYTLGVMQILVVFAAMLGME